MSLENVALKGVEAKDSRGRPTVEAILTIGEIEVRGDVPAGASKGEDEAKTLPVSEALDVIEGEILDYLKTSGKSLENHDDLLALEKGLIERAGENYARLGANAVLPVSRALWRAAACLQKKELAAYIREHEPELSSNGRVFFLMNIFNGGLHALKEAEGEVLG
ncbi:MAG: hypothetical protein VYA34_11000 [Myxococcota bacterium]|nr:hypothetical protein [Myxococcota bacterium]